MGDTGAEVIRTNGKSRKENSDVRGRTMGMAGDRRGGEGRGREKRDPDEDHDGDSCRRTHFNRRYSRYGKDHHGPGIFQSYGAGGEARAVYTGRAAVRSDGFYDLSERDRAVCLSAGSSDVQSAACG